MGGLSRYRAEIAIELCPATCDRLNSLNEPSPPKPYSSAVPSWCCIGASKSLPLRMSVAKLAFPGRVKDTRIAMWKPMNRKGWLAQFLPSIHFASTPSLLLIDAAVTPRISQQCYVKSSGPYHINDYMIMPPSMSPPCENSNAKFLIFETFFFSNSFRGSIVSNRSRRRSWIFRLQCG